MGILWRLAVVTTCGFVLLVLLQHLLCRDVEEVPALPEGVEATRPVQIADVLAANIPTPIRSKVSLPGFSYRQAFPEATDSPEITIKSYQESPLLAARTKLPANDPMHLPPVAKRLPRNPAVVVGCDGVGQYGGEWRRCGNHWTLGTKIGYETFVRFGPSGETMPGVAYKWTVSPDNRTYTFYLRKGHRWSDGKPFTAHDIAWVCNENIGSPHWPTAPNWMQPTDGTIRFYIEDVPNWRNLAERIVAEADSGQPSPGKRLMDLLNRDSAGVLRKLAAGTVPVRSKLNKLVSDMGSVFLKPEFFEAEAWKALDLESELKALEALDYSKLTKKQKERMQLLLVRNNLVRDSQKPNPEMTPGEIAKRNILMFRLAYKGLVAEAAKKRVVVETVADENGDDSHIIRFTFSKPNSFFLEKTSTFMFYRGLFQMPRHFYKYVHVDGIADFAYTDVIDWVKVLEQLRAPQKGANPGALKQLLSLLPKDFSARLLSLPLDDSESLLEKLTKSDRQRFFEELNKIASGTELYQAADWMSLDTRAELEELEKLTHRKFLHTEWNRYDELRDGADLLNRVQKGKISDLGKDELVRLNVQLIRRAFSREALAFNREAGLNHYAQNGPRRYSTWVNRMRAMGNYHPDHNPHLPVITAWRLVSETKERQLLAIRNPYYYKVDAKGNQLPYLDKVISENGNEHSVLLLKLRSGSVDFQVRDLTFQDFTVLKQHEKEGGYEVRLWANDYCGEVNFRATQAHKNPEYRRLLGDPRFRHALSSALNRQEIIDVCFKGMGTPAQYSIPKGSPYYNAKLATASVEHDIAKANRLLDEMGLNKRSMDGMRKFWSGKPILLDVSSTDRINLQVVQMACNYWQAVGLNAQMKIRSGSLINRMTDMGKTDIVATWEGANYFGPILAGAFAPTHPAECYQWSPWVKFIHSGGALGEDPPEWMRTIEDTWQEVVHATSREKKMAAWQQLTDIAARDLPFIGVTTSPGRVVYVRKGFKNVPKIALAGWIAHEPGNTCPEAFWIDPKERQ